MGHLELTRGEESVLPGRRKLLAVLVYLARQRGRPVSRTRLAVLFWPVEDDTRARRSVRQALTDLRRAAGDELRETDDAVSLNPEAIHIDTLELDAAIAAGDYRRAVELWGGDFLAGCEDVGGGEFRGWLEAERQGIRSQFAAAVEKLADQAERHGAWESGLELTRAWIAALPYDEHANGRHIRLLALAGRGTEAAAARQSFVQQLRSDLGQEPSPAFNALTERALEPNGVAVRPPRSDRSVSPAGKGLFSPDLVAREAEFGILTGLWQEVAAGNPEVALIEGEDGSGKSRLAEEFLRWVRQREPKPVVLQARAFEAERARPWVLLRHLLAGLASAPGVGACPAPVLKLLAKLIPEIADRFPALPPGEPEGSPVEAVARAVADVAAERPVLILVDDAHHADQESQAVLEALVRRPVGGVCTLLITTPNGLPNLLGLERGQAAGRLVRLELGPLSEASVERMLSGMAEFAPADRRALAARLTAESGGNPLGAIELVMTLADRGVIAPGPDGMWALENTLGEALPVPISIRNAVATRLRQLPENATRVLEAAAVLGRETDPGVLREASGLDASKLDDALDQLISRRFLRLVGDGSLRVEFIHETARQAVYQGLSPARRQRVHRRAWRALQRSGPRDEARHAALAYHRARMDRGAGKPLRWLVAASVLLALGVVTATLIQPVSKVTAFGTSIAVLPFDVRGGTGYAYLGEGMVTLLGGALDGLGGLSTVDSRGLLSFVAGKPPTPDQGRAAARHFGAGLFVLGDIIEANGRLELEASLYDGVGRLQGTGRASTATEAGIYGAVDEIAKQLALSRRTGPTEEITRVAAATTSSLPALKAYLAGEQLLRAGNFSAAVDSFQVAVATDTAFALAYYRLAIAAEWDQRAGLPERAAASAARYDARLTERSRALVEALLAWRNGEFTDARDRYLAILSRYPKDLEAWFQLGEVLFHAGPMLGHSVAGAKTAWQQVLALEPGNTFAQLHLARIAAAEDDSSGLAAVAPRVPALQKDGDRRLLELAAWRALVFRNDSETARVLGYMQRPVPTGTTSWQLTVYSRNLDGSDRFARHLLTQVPGLGETLLLHLKLARGQWRAARLSSVSVPDEQPIIVHAYTASLPFVPIQSGELLRLRDELRAWKPAGWDHREEEVSNQEQPVYSELRLYLLGTLSVRAGDFAGATRYGEDLERRARVTYDSTLVRDLARGLRAMVARGEHHPETALTLLESIRPHARRSQLESLFFSRALERYLRAELLVSLGRGAEALPWYDAMAQLSPGELVFLAPSHLRRAEIYEAMGDRAEAVEHYTRFIGLWKDADAESQQQVSEARARLRRLGGRTE